MFPEVVNAFASLDESRLIREIEDQRNRGASAGDLVGALQAGLARIDERYARQELFLADLVVACQLFQEAVGRLGDPERPHRGVLVIGTIYGDQHDMGKNVVASVFACHGYQVVDLGVDVPTGDFLAAIRTHRPRLLGISCLLTTGFDAMKECIGSIRAEGLDRGLRILIGGGPCGPDTAEYVGADAYCRTSQEALALDPVPDPT